MGTLILWPILACSIHTEVSGIVRVGLDSERVHLDTLRNDSFVLKAGNETEIFQALAGNSVALAGPRLGKTLWVRHWRVLTSTDGSTPYVGRLEKHGSNLILLDRNSGRGFSFDEASLALLQDSVGNSVLIRGFVVAPHVLHVVGWKNLQEAGD
jgi:hypothetical protein